MARHVITKRSGRIRLAVMITVVALTALLSVIVISDFVVSRTRGSPPPHPAGAAPGAPLAPVARPCEKSVLGGPSTPPADAVVVSTDARIGDVVSAHPPGSTFWLAPGTHHIGTGPYAQVIPRTGDTFVGAPGAILDGRRDNRYAFGGEAADVTISWLTIQNFGSPGNNGDEGVVNHDSGQGWTMVSNTVQNNAGAGVMVGSDNRLSDNCLRNNGQYGFSVYHPRGVRNVTLERNEIFGNNTDDWEARSPGCGCTGGGKFWETQNARVIDNYVHDNRGAGIWADTNNSGFHFEGNYISDNDAEGLLYETSYNAVIVNNTFARNALVKGPTNRKFPASAIYLSESGGDPRAPGPYAGELRVSGNQFINNWSGVIAWENANRFAGSPANTSTGATTLVNPTTATVEACATKAKISEQPYFDDCRWKTQNVTVESNVFQADQAQIPLCARSNGCGFNGLFSNYGTFPLWSPFKGTVVEHNITFKQNNIWRDNTYVGDWSFMAEEAGNEVSWDVWRADPYRQDVGSTMN